MTQEELRAALSRIATMEAETQSTLLHRFAQAVAPTRAFAEVYRRIGPSMDRWLLRVTRGRVAPKVWGFPALLLRTAGAKTGQARTTPLYYVREGADFFVVGTNFGTAHHPAWTANLLKQSNASITIGEDTLPVRAELLDEARFQTLWPRFTAMYGGYDAYLERLTSRRPRMFRLSPQTS